MTTFPTFYPHFISIYYEFGPLSLENRKSLAVMVHDVFLPPDMLTAPHIATALLYARCAFPWILPEYSTNDIYPALCAIEYIGMFAYFCCTVQDSHPASRYVTAFLAFNIWKGAARYSYTLAKSYSFMNDLLEALTCVRPLSTHL